MGRISFAVLSISMNRPNNDVFSDK